MERGTATKWAVASVVLALVAIVTIALRPASEERSQIEALASSDLEEVRQAADRLAAAGSTTALGPLGDARHRLVDLMVESGNQDLKRFGHLDFDLMMRRVSDRRQSSEARRLWRALAAVTRAIAVLDPHEDAARGAASPDWELPTEEDWASDPEIEWEMPTQEEWEDAAGETEDEVRAAEEGVLQIDEQPEVEEEPERGIEEIGETVEDASER